MSLALPGEFPGFEDSAESRGPSWVKNNWQKDGVLDRTLLEAEIRDRLPYATDVQLMGIIAIVSAAEERVTRLLSEDDTDMYDNGVNP